MRGGVLLSRESFAAAVESFARAAALEPDSPAYAANHAEALRRAGRPDAALDALAGVIERGLADGPAWWNHGIALAAIGDAPAACKSLSRALDFDPTLASVHGSLLFTMLHDARANPARLLALQRACGERFSRVAAVARPVVRRAGRLRVGYVSGDLRRHALAYFLEPLLACHDTGRFEVYCYRTGGREDEVTARLRALATHWRDIEALDDDAAAALIAADGIDVLVDLAGHTAGNRLGVFARRPAPRQLSWAGYLGGTGLAAIDARITDGLADPFGAEVFQSGSLLRLPRCQWCYRPPAEAPETGPLPAHSAGLVTFGALHSIVKLSDAALADWARVLVAVPASRLMVFGVPAGRARERVQAPFRAARIDTARLAIHERVDFDRYWQTYRSIDIVLDAHPYNGATTTCEALWMGVPVVTLAGSHGAARSGASLLAAVGLPELVAANSEAYVAAARTLAADLPRLGALRSSLRDRMAGSPLRDEAGFARAFEAALEANVQDARAPV